MKNRRVGIVLSYANTGLSMITGLYLSSFLLRILGDTEYGIYQTVASFANYLVLLEFGTGTVITRNLSICRSKGAPQEEVERNVSTIWTITCVLATVILAVSVVFYLALDSVYRQSMTPAQIAYGKKILVLVTLCLVLSFIQQTFGGVILACEDYTFTAKMNIIKTVLRVVLLTGLLLQYQYSILIAAVDTVLAFCLGGYSYLYCRTRCKVRFGFRKFDRTIFRDSFPLSAAIFIQALVNQANSNVDKFVIGIKMNPESVALYSVALYIYTAFSQVSTVPISMYGPQTIKDVAAGVSGKALADSLAAPCRLVSFLGGGILFGFACVGRQFIEIVYGKNYLLCWPIALIIMFPMFLNMTTGVLVNVLDAQNRRMARSLALLFTTAANIVLTVLWIDRYGMVGAALATAVCTLAGQVLFMNAYYDRKMGIPILYMYKKAFHGILVFQIMGAVLALALGRIISNVYVSFVVCGIVYVVIACAGFYRTDLRPKLRMKSKGK